VQDKNREISPLERERKLVPFDRQRSDSLHVKSRRRGIFRRSATLPNPTGVGFLQYALPFF